MPIEISVMLNFLKFFLLQSVSAIKRMVQYGFDTSEINK